MLIHDPKFGIDFISGMGKVAGKFVIILNVQNVLSVDEIAVLSGTGQSEA